MSNMLEEYGEIIECKVIRVYKTRTIMIEIIRYSMTRVGVFVLLFMVYLMR